jgi:hypothetical protein
MKWKNYLGCVEIGVAVHASRTHLVFSSHVDWYSLLPLGSTRSLSSQQGLESPHAAYRNSLSLIIIIIIIIKITYNLQPNSLHFWMHLLLPEFISMTLQNSVNKKDSKRIETMTQIHQCSTSISVVAYVWSGYQGWEKIYIRAIFNHSLLKLLSSNLF